MPRNNPTAAQQPPPPFANDPNGFFSAVLTQNSTSGIVSLLPSDTLFQSDVAAKGRLLLAQIGWTPTKAHWGGCDLNVSLTDSQFALMLEEGGDTQTGRVTVILEKLQLGGKSPQQGDTFKIQAGGKWHEFVVVEMAGQHDDNEPGLTLFLSKDQNELGN